MPTFCIMGNSIFFKFFSWTVNSFLLSNNAHRSTIRQDALTSWTQRFSAHLLKQNCLYNIGNCHDSDNENMAHIYAGTIEFIEEQKNYSGRSKGARGTHAPNFFQFHAVFGKIWQNYMLPPQRLAPPPRGNPGFATEL